jgi:DNA polymerase-1
LVHRAIQALNLPLLLKEGFEADDLIATLTIQAVGLGFSVVIVSADKDLTQLVSDSVIMVDPMKGIRYDRDGVFQKMGVWPEQVLDLLGLMGDTADNIPGIKGVGSKTATRLLAEHGTLESALAAAPSMKKSKMKERLLGGFEQAHLSRELARLHTQVEIDQSPNDLLMQAPLVDDLDEFLAEMEFSNLRRELIGKKTIDTDQYLVIADETDLATVVKEIQNNGVCAIALATTSKSPMLANIVGIGLCPQDGRAVYIPVAHQTEQSQLEMTTILAHLRPIFCDPDIRWVGQNLKYDAMVLARCHNLTLANMACDAMLASYVLDPGRANHGLDNLSRDILGHEMIPYETVVGKGKKEIPFSAVPVEQACTYSGEIADVAFRLCRTLLVRIEKAGMQNLLSGIELPLTYVLMDMEMAGILLDLRVLDSLSKEADSLLEESKSTIFQLAGHEFNQNSPSQLRVVLFEELGLPVIKKNKSGPSTDQSVLEELSVEHDLPTAILVYRSLAKLKSTYLDVLPKMIHPKTGRIHTSYNQAVTATGRLSSSNPNLQNVPIRTRMGKRIREAFVAPEGYRILSADYNQVELRILAHLTQDEAFLDAFAQGEDIHAGTAAKIFSVFLSTVTSEMRARAKAVNFGIVYGQGAYTLSRQLGIRRDQAQEIIDAYKSQYKQVSAWVDRIHQEAREKGYVTTLFKRRRFLPDINSRSFSARKNAERIAQNTPIQGTAADIIKKAMVSIHRSIQQKKMSARMLLQVHDELVFEVPEDEALELEWLVRKEMEQAADLSVPLAVDITSGHSWAEAH